MLYLVPLYIDLLHGEGWKGNTSWYKIYPQEGEVENYAAQDNIYLLYHIEPMNIASLLDCR